jgi:hypothetical protein
MLDTRKRFRLGGIACATAAVLSAALIVAAFISPTRHVLVVDLDHVPAEARALWASGQAEGRPVGTDFPGCRWGVAPAERHFDHRRHGNRAARAGIDFYPAYCVDREAAQHLPGPRRLFELQQRFETQPGWRVVDRALLVVNGFPLGVIESFAFRYTPLRWMQAGADATAS